MVAIVMCNEYDLAPVYGQLGNDAFLMKVVQSRKVIATVAKWARAALKILLFLCTVSTRGIFNVFEFPVYRSS